MVSELVSIQLSCTCSAGPSLLQGDSISSYAHSLPQFSTIYQGVKKLSYYSNNCAVNYSVVCRFNNQVDFGDRINYRCELTYQLIS